MTPGCVLDDPGCPLTVWVWSMAVEASEWGSLYLEVLVHTVYDGDSVSCQHLKSGKNTNAGTKIS